MESCPARCDARARGADEALRLGADGHAVAGATCNVFAVSGGTVTTPAADTGALPGIVRARVLELCVRAGIRTALRSLTLRDVRGADELFVTGSLRGVVPVTRLDGGLRPSGPVTARLASAYVGAMRVAP
jgi:branched-subunit amino acid aminotransferase/4-amino-4-deoxychorismate lyase